MQNWSNVGNRSDAAKHFGSTMPREYMSVFGDEEPKPYCSGAAYPGVPISTVSDSFCPENCFAALKSKSMA